jgi:hypothetical protein
MLRDQVPAAKELLSNRAPESIRRAKSVPSRREW